MRILLRGVHPCVVLTIVGVVAVVGIVEAFVQHQHQWFHQQHSYYRYQQHRDGTQKKKKTRNHNSNSNSIFLLHLQEEDNAPFEEEDEKEQQNQQQRQLRRRRREFVLDAVGAGLLVASGSSFYQLYQTNLYTPPGIKRFHWSSPQFLAALGDPTASNGTISQDSFSSWGIWEHDPGPRGVKLQNFQQDILATEYRAQPVGWTFDPQSWWLEEHGLIMESPTFPIPVRL